MVVPSGSGIPERSFDLDALRKCKSYSDLAFQIFRKFISAEEIPDKDLGTSILFFFHLNRSHEFLAKLAVDSYKEFPSDPVPVKELPNGTYAVELFHGPTFCFKDLGQQVLW